MEAVKALDKEYVELGVICVEMVVIRDDSTRRLNGMVYRMKINERHDKRVGGLRTENLGEGFGRQVGLVMQCQRLQTKAVDE